MKIPTFNYNDPSSWDRYQTKMKEKLFSTARETDPIKIDNDIESWLNIARNGTLQQCVSMYSVIQVFYPNKIHDSYFKSRIQYFYERLSTIITSKQTEQNASKSIASTPVKSSVAPKPKSNAKVEKNKNFEIDFPKFEGDGFPSSESNIFDKLLKIDKTPETEKEVHRDKCTN